MEVRNDEAGGRFYIPMDGGDAELEYELLSGDILHLKHTHVPEAGRGEGMGGSLVEAAMSHARENDLSVRVSCPFIGSWLDEHPEARDIVVP